MYVEGEGGRGVAVGFCSLFHFPGHPSRLLLSLSLSLDPLSLILRRPLPPSSSSPSPPPPPSPLLSNVISARQRLSRDTAAQSDNGHRNDSDMRQLRLAGTHAKRLSRAGRPAARCRSPLISLLPTLTAPSAATCRANLSAVWTAAATTTLASASIASAASVISQDTLPRCGPCLWSRAALSACALFLTFSTAAQECWMKNVNYRNVTCQRCGNPRHFSWQCSDSWRQFASIRVRFPAPQPARPSPFFFFPCHCHFPGAHARFCCIGLCLAV